MKKPRFSEASAVKVECLIIGAGMYGLYAAGALLGKSRSVLVIDADEGPFLRASYVNQARLHNGYHYPRSYSTARASARYFDRFLKDYEDCIERDFAQIYAIAGHYSWTDGEQFRKFCGSAGIFCETVPTEKYFDRNSVESAFLAREYSFDARLLKEKLWRAAEDRGCGFLFGVRVAGARKDGGEYAVTLGDGREVRAKFLLNASYAGTNQIHRLFGFKMLDIKYELCEVILCTVSDNIRHVGLTVMDGPFFSIMPFGRSGFHSITTVSKTPHYTSYEALPTFACQSRREGCTPEHSLNCNGCPCRPETAFAAMAQTAKKYVKSDIKIEYVQSLFAFKPILKTSEIDDSRPTLIRQYSENPDFYTVFSGKINTMYELDAIL
jgi:hypothetical protein